MGIYLFIKEPAIHVNYVLVLWKGEGEGEGEGGGGCECNIMCLASHLYH